MNFTRYLLSNDKNRGIVILDGTLGSVLSTQTFTYGKDGWGDVLTKINSTTVTSDASGNLLSDGTNTYTWKNGRQLATSTKNGVTWTYTYDANGMRTQRASGSTVYAYIYDGGNLSQMTVGSNALIFTYGINGQPMSVNYNGTDYYYITNSQGDVVGILNGSGTEVVTYNYDAWGNLLSTGGTMASSLGLNNPLRYRGYVYDRETGLYYLQSRYYNPTIGRFISADNYPSTGQGLTGNNMFIYCGNNPVSRADEGGECWNVVIGAVVGAVVGGAVAAYTSYKQNGMIDWASVAISAAAGGVCGAVAATGLNMFVQAGISAFASGVGNLFDQAQSKGWDGINGWDVAVSTALGFGTALLGTGAGKIIGGKWAKEASRLSQLGKDKLLTGFLRQSVGQSHSSLMKQGYRYIAQAVRSTNIYQGVSSVAGSFIGGAVGFGYNMLKSSVLG